MPPRIVIDFDAASDVEEEVEEAAQPAAAAAGGDTKATDVLRSIQSMRLTLQRLEQQKQQHAAAGGGAAALPGDVLDKQASLQAQVRAWWEGSRSASAHRRISETGCSA